MRTRVIIWSASLALFLALAIGFALTDPYLAENYANGGIAVTTAAYVQDLLVAVTPSLVAIAILAQVRSAAAPTRALRHYAIALAAIVVLDSIVWWSDVAPRHMYPGPEPGEDFGAGLISVELAVAGPFLVLGLELSLTLIATLLARLSARKQAG